MTTSHWLSLEQGDNHVILHNKTELIRQSLTTDKC